MGGYPFPRNEGHFEPPCCVQGNLAYRERTTTGGCCVSVIFVLVFLAAVVGIFKPYIKGWKRAYFAIAAAVSFIVVGITAEPTKTATNAKPGATGNDTSGTSANTPVSSDDNANSDARETVSASNWEYRNDTDRMRGTSTVEATVTSNNTVDLQFPYGEVHGELWVRKRGGSLDAAFEVEKGQVLCNSFIESVVSIKFDDRAIQKFRCTDASDGSNNVAFLLPAGRFLSEVKKSKRAIVEAEFFQQGRQQFTFDTTGLTWPPKTTAEEKPKDLDKDGCSPSLAAKVGLNCSSGGR
jgi:hypothetical protein